MEPIRIGQIIGPMRGGGVESVVMNYYRHIDREKIQFDFIVEDDSTIVPVEEIENLGGRVYFIPSYRRLHKYIPALIRLLRENKYTIVHAHMNTLCVFPLYAAKRAGIQVRIAHSHSTAGKGETLRNIIKYSLRPFSKVFATHYAACSKYAGEWLFGKKTMERGEVTIFNNAIDLDKFRYREDVREQVRKELGLEGKFVIGHVGRFRYQKNQEFLIDIFSEVHKRSPNAVLLLVGDGKDRVKIEEKVRKMDLGREVIFLGTRDDVDRLYQAMDVLVLPSRYEGLPVVGVEAQATGLPCLLSDQMTKEVKMTEDVIFLSLDCSAEEWADRIWRLIEHQRNNHTDLIQHAGFSIEEQSQHLFRYYMNIIK